MRVCRIHVLAAVLTTALASHAIAQSAALVCSPPQHPGKLAELMFGRDIGGRVAVSESAWRRFVAREITPRFPDGLTITSATGQWRDGLSGAIVREPSKLVLIVLPGRADDQARLDAVVNAYKRQFRQQAVGVIEQPACISF